MAGVGFVIVIVFILLYLVLIMPRVFHKPDRTPFLEHKLFAHRGLHDNASDAPENSMAAFLKAVEAGYGIELDVQLSKDKIPVVFHDATLQRICGAEGAVKDYTYEELQQFKLYQSKQKIPAFDEVLKNINGRVPLIVEYKSTEMSAEVCLVADELLKKYCGAYCIESFNPMILYWYRKNRADVMRGQLSMNYLKAKNRHRPGLLYFALQHLLFNFLTKPDFIAYDHYDYKNWSRQICRYLYKNMAVAWTLRNNSELSARRKDFDVFIFDSFVPVQNKKAEI